MVEQVRQAAGDERIRRRRAIWLAWRCLGTIHRGVPGGRLPAPNANVGANPDSARDDAVGADGLPQSPAQPAWHPGLVQSQGPGVSARRKEEGLFRDAGVLPFEGRELTAAEFRVYRLVHRAVTAKR